MKCKWLIDLNILSNPHHDNFASVCKDLGVEHQILSYSPIGLNFGIDPFDEKPRFKERDCVVAYGKLPFIKALRFHHRGYFPSCYMVDKNFACSKYFPKIPNHLLLNSEYMMLPYHELKRRKENLYNLFNTDKLFIRPDRGVQHFSGNTIEYHKFEEEINKHYNKSNIKEGKMLLIANYQNIEKEYRIVIGNKTIIGASLFRVNNEIDTKEGAPYDVLKVASEIAQLEWQPDNVYIIDISVLSTGECKLSHLNSFSCSELYAMDIKEVIEKVSHISEKHYHSLML